jgi:hypothetical protein
MVPTCIRKNAAAEGSPMVKRPFLAVLIFSLIDLAAPPVWAKPKHTPFKEVMAQSDSIVVAKLKGEPDGKTRKARLDILQVLKGNLKPGHWEVSFSDFPHGGPEEFIAFLDKDAVWRFTARPLAGKQVADDVLLVSGFYDYNAHWVTPGLLTLEQLKGYLQNGSLTYKFEGDIFFPQPGKTDWKAGTLRITGSYDAVTKKTDVSGFPALKGLPAQPEVVSLHHYEDDARLDLAYSRSGYRPLHVLGKVSKLDAKTGTLVVRFAVSEPDVLTQKALEDYLADDAKGPTYYTFKLTCAATKEHPQPRVLTYQVGKRFGPDEVSGWDKAPLKVISTSYNGPTVRSGSATRALPAKVDKDLFAEDWVLRVVAETDAHEFLVLAFDLGEPKTGKDMFRWTFQNDLLYALYNNPVGGKLQLHDGKTLQTLTTFTATLDSTGFIVNDRK